jgi:hypothetical protein
MAKQSITIRRGAAKRVVFTLRRNAALLNVSGAQFAFAVKKTYTDDTYQILKRDGVFDKTAGAAGQVSFILSSADTLAMTPGKYKGQLKTTLAVDDVDISDEIVFTVEATAFHIYTGTSTSTTTTTT